jgi:hypothetical protein
MQKKGTYVRPLVICSRRQSWRYPPAGLGVSASRVGGIFLQSRRYLPPFTDIPSSHLRYTTLYSDSTSRQSQTCTGLTLDLPQSNLRPAPLQVWTYPDPSLDLPRSNRRPAPLQAWTYPDPGLDPPRSNLRPAPLQVWTYPGPGLDLPRSNLRPAPLQAWTYPGLTLDLPPIQSWTCLTSFQF